MPALQNGKVIYSGGEALPTMGSEQYKQAQSGVLPTTQAPTNAAQITPTSSISLPSITPTVSGTSPVNGLVAFYQKQFDLYNQQQADYQAQQQQLQKTQAEQTAPFLQRLLGAPTPAESRASAMDETGINAREYFASQQASLEEIKKLNEDYNAEVAKKDAEIARIRDNAEGKFGNAINEDVARTERDYGIRLAQMSANINTKAAIYEAEQGRFNEAQQYVNQAVQDATAETRFNMDMYRTFYEMNQDAIDSVDAKYRDAFKSAMDSAEKAYQLDYETKLKSISNAAGLDTYTIKAGDTLYEIAQSMGITVDSLLNSNQAVNPNNLRPGQTIYLPGKNYSPNTSVTNVQLTQFINQQMATPEFKALTAKEKSDYIRSQGGNPEDFGL